MSRSRQYLSICWLCPNGLHSIWLTTGRSGCASDRVHLFGGVIADADVTRKALVLCFNQPSPDSLTGPLPRRAVDEHEVGVVEAQLTQTIFRGAIAVLG